MKQYLNWDMEGVVMFEILLKRLDAFILKHHKCRNHMQKYSQTWETRGALTICTDVEQALLKKQAEIEETFPR